MAGTAEPLIGLINAGSSSLKFSFYDGETRVLSGQVDGSGAQPRVSAVGPAANYSSCPSTDIHIGVFGSD